jgi:GNAT superfamily N-acetyltransferase
MTDVKIVPITTLVRVELAALLEDAARGGFTFVARLVSEWERSENRFDREGERLFGAYRGELLVGCGGINVDPYVDDPRLGRIRHVYVLSSERRAHVGRALLDAILAHAADHFDRVRLKTETLDAVRFYESFGFAARVIEGGFELTRAVTRGA